MTSKENIKTELVNYKPNDEERLIIRSAVFNFVTTATLGAAALGMSARFWAKSRATPLKPRTGIPTILGTFSGLVFGGALGMDRGMRTLRQQLPQDSHLLQLIHANDEIKKQQQQQQETLFSGLPITVVAEEESSTQDLLADTTDTTTPPVEELDLLETQLLLDAGEENK